MISKCGRLCEQPCVTRWNSTLNMMKRLLETKTVLSQVLDELGIDTLLTSDWSKLEQLVKLFEPFAVHTDQLQTDSQSLSEAVPCLLNLEAHLQSSVISKPLDQIMLKSLRECFACLLNPQAADFDATPAAACLMDPTVAFALFTTEMERLMKAARSCVLQHAAHYSSSSVSQQQMSSVNPQCATSATAEGTVLKRFKFLASKVGAELTPTSGNTTGNAGSAHTELSTYISEMKQGKVCCETETPSKFWQNKEIVYPRLAPVAEDLLAVPASQAFVERIFSVCGQLSSGRRNRMDTSLEQRVFLKMNQKLLLSNSTNN
ncbi:UNVERIFIED_CONTAM: hypothetical protein FKN15_055603 [Acipenser sinensis]